MHMTRRVFLAATASLSAFPAAHGARGAEETRTISLGFSLYGMKSLTLSRALQTCADLGYDCVELAALPDWPADPRTLTAADRADIREQLTDLQLGLSAIMENVPVLAPAAEQVRHLDRLRAVAELGPALSPDNPPVIETVLGGKPAEWELVKQAMADQLQKWGELAEASKVVIAVKPHVGGALHTPEGAVWLLQQIHHPRIRLAFDFSHFFLLKFPLPETVAALVPLSVFAHVKDAQGTAEKFEFLLPGESGSIDYADLLGRAFKAGYRGSVVVEVSGMISGRAGYDPVAAAKKSYEFLAPAFVKAGVPRA